MEVIYGWGVEECDIPVRGYAMVSGDDAADKEVEDEIIRRRNSGDVWAWATVTVSASVRVSGKTAVFKGTTSLGGCSYANEAEFMHTGEYETMKMEAFDDLHRHLLEVKRLGEEAAFILRSVKVE